MAKDKVISRLPGFRDFPPDELRVRTHVFDHWRATARRYGFQEYDGPPLEALELYTQKSGDEIVGQLSVQTLIANLGLGRVADFSRRDDRALASSGSVRWSGLSRLHAAGAAGERERQPDR